MVQDSLGVEQKTEGVTFSSGRITWYHSDEAIAFSLASLTRPLEWIADFLL